MLVYYSRFLRGRSLFLLWTFSLVELGVGLFAGIVLWWMVWVCWGIDSSWIWIWIWIWLVLYPSVS